MATSHYIGPLRVGALEGAASSVVLDGRGPSLFPGPMRIGPVRAAGSNMGNVVLSQSVSYNFTALSAESFTMGLLPASAQIIDILVDVVTAWDSVNARLSVGDASASSLYMGSGSGVDIASAGRVPGSGERFNGAQVASMYTLNEAKTVMGFILNSTAPGAGSLRATLVYVHRG